MTFEEVRNNETISKIHICRAVVLSSVCSNASPSQVITEVDQVEAHKWRDDLRYMSEEMRKWHINLSHATTEVQFVEAIRKLDQQIPSLARHQIIVGWHELLQRSVTVIEIVYNRHRRRSALHYRSPIDFEHLHS